MSNPLRILHVVVNMNRGGAETLIMNLYRNIDRSRIQFDFLTCKEGVFDSEIEALGGRVHRIPYVTDVGHFGYINALNRFFIAHSEYQMVHAHMNQMSGFVLRAAKKAGVPVRIAHSHNTSNQGGIAAKTYKFYAGKYISTCATHLLACSRAAARWLFADQAKKAILLNNGIEVDRFSFSEKTRHLIRKDLHLKEDHFVVGHVGRFTKQKNHSFLIDFFSRLVKVKPQSVLILVGDGPLRKNMEQKARDLGIVKHVKFLGVRSDIHHLLQSFDVFAFPSFHEGLPVTLIEAQCSGLPCLISDAITNEVDMELGLINYAPIHGKNLWVDKLINMMDLKKHSARTIDLEQVAKKGYDIKNTAKSMHHFYMELRGERIEEINRFYTYV